MLEPVPAQFRIIEERRGNQATSRM
ncbi:uncharacterized protein SOCEGT47_028700 [Sorangium cellulosum]|uniref:Uncharacterized protein n=1 Tax=Sorangium cellulosum TaxID=56 RepID=A0A4P2PZN2_SORCE|nr:uncharacterized protein SOCEGT47_028700 [Sorangium cellulosum]